MVISLRIALLTYSTKPRGSVIHTLELAEALHRLGHTVCVYALDKDGVGFDFPLSCNYQLIPARSAPAQIDQLIRQRIQEFVDVLSYCRQSFDCYHAQDCISANALAVLSRKHLIPRFIRTVHHIEDYQSQYLQQCQDQSIQDATLCLCVSQHWQAELQRQYQIKAPRVINGVNLKRFSTRSLALQSTLRERWQLTGKPIYLSVGGIEPRKNSMRLLQAFAQVLHTHPQAQLVIAGGATLFDYQDYRNEFFEQVRQLGIAEQRSLILPGVIADAELPALYQLADAFVFPSLKEGWGLVLLEAIAAGLPVITANQAPFTEFLSPAQALLVHPDSTAAIAQAMRQVTQSDLALALVHQSQPILAQYTWEASARLHVFYYQQFLKSYA
jgi:glycosyltransferase-like protein